MKIRKLLLMDKYMGYFKRGCRMLTMLALVSFFNVGSAAAQCVVGKMDFSLSSKVDLCNPQLSNDEDGWFNEDVADELDACKDFYATPSNVAQLGMASNVLSVPGAMITEEAWTDNKATQNAAANSVGYSAIVANPKIIDPLLLEVPGKNLLVSFGNSHDKTYIMGYSVSGLKPGSTATLTCVVYNLIDPASLAASATAAASTKEIKICGQTYNPQQDMVYGQAGAIVTTATSLNTNGAVQGLSTTIGYGESKKISIKATVDEYGNASFYIGKGGGTNSIPVGITDVEVVGTIKPEIDFNDNPCPKMPAVVNLKQKYPAGTTFSWKESTTGQTSSTASFSFQPPSEGKYKISCTVDMGNGCTASAADDFTLEVGKCCESEAGVAMAKVNIYYNDFGSFSGSTYTYLNSVGQSVSVPTKDMMDCGAGGVPAIEDQLGGFGGIKYNNNPCTGTGGYAISTIDPYTRSIEDKKAPGTGGFMVMDLKDKNFDKVIFEKVIPDLCVGRTLYFNTDIASANNKAAENAHIDIVVIEKHKDGTEIEKKRWERTLTTSTSWINNYLEFTVTEESDLVLRIESKDANYPDDKGDMALDNIFLQVCAPPSIPFDWELNSDKSLLDLCTGDVLTLKAEPFSTLTEFYGGDPKYMFQYTYDDPKTMDPEDVTWVTMDLNGQTIFDSPNFNIEEPATHKAFSGISDGDEKEVTFRVVVGREATLKDPKELKVNAQSPCRNISVSNMFVTASLNCAACTKPDDVVFAAEGGKFDKKTKTVELCKEDDFTTLSMTNKVHGIDKNGDDYYDYTVSWHKEKVSGAGETSAITSKDSPNAPTMKVKWSDASQEGTKYIISIHDNFDTDPTACDITDTIIVIANPEPVVPEIEIPAFCKGIVDDDVKAYLKNELTTLLKGLEAEITDPDGAAVAVADLEKTLEKLAAGENEFKITVTDEETGCVSEEGSFTVKVKAIPEKPTVKDDGYVMKKGEVQSLEGHVVKKETDATVNWYENKNDYPGKGSEDPIKIPLDEEKKFTYWVSQTLDGCESDTASFTATVNDAPTPKTENIQICVKSETNPNPSVDLTTLVTDGDPADPTAQFTLNWYAKEDAEKGTGDKDPSNLTIDYTKTGVQSFYVSQTNMETGAESGKSQIKVEIFKAKALSPLEEAIYCDDEQNPTPLVKLVEDGEDYERANEIVWYLDGVEYEKGSAPKLGNKRDIVYNYKAVQKYYIVDGDGNTVETCVSDTTTYTVKAFYTEAAADAQLAYIAAEVGGDGKTFPALDTKDQWEEDPDYTYFYSLKGEENYSTTVPNPKYDVTKLNGGSAQIDYDVYRVKKGADKDCKSEVSTITVTISDAMPPSVKDFHYCEGGTLENLKATINAMAGHTYSLYWYTSRPANTTDKPDFVGDEYKLSGTAKVDGGEITSTSYWVAQHDNETEATSVAMELHVVVYPKPTLKITDPEATCGSDGEFVDITKTWRADNTDEEVTATYSAEVPTRVEESGKYQIAGTYDIPGKAHEGSNQVTVVDQQCKGEEFDVNVEVNYLTQPTIGNQPTVCPGKEISLKAEATSTDPGDGEITYEWGGYSTDKGDKTTKTASDQTGTTHIFKVTAKAGACTSTSEDYSVEVGNGKLAGTIEFTERDNAEFPATLDENKYDGDVSHRTYYSCGGAITVKSNMTKSEGDFAWYKGSKKIAEGDILTIEETTKYGEEIYTLKYINDCETEIDFRIITVPLAVEYVGPDTTVVLCEGEVFETKAKVTCQETPEGIQWYRGDDEGNRTPVGMKKEQLGIERVVKLDEGTYSCEVTNRGCKAVTKTDKLIVHPNVDARFTLGEEPVVVQRHLDQKLSVSITKPADGKLSDIVWYKDKEEVLRGYDAEYTELDVTADHEYIIELNDPDYCGTVLNGTIWVDALIQLEADVKDTICEGQEERLTIDTTGTGLFRSNFPYELKVTEEVGGITTELKKFFPTGDGKLYTQISPKTPATYTIVASYGSQNKEIIKKVHVIPAITFDLPATETLCEGEQVTLAVQNVSPKGTTISWERDNTIVSASADSLEITVQPTYNKEKGEQHQFRYTYRVWAKNSVCKSETAKKPVYVLVDEPITGEMEGKAIICDGFETFVDAKNFDAATYQWSSSDGEDLGTSSRITRQPNHSVTYTVDMTRGTCSAKESYLVEVKSLPAIISIDSVGYHDRDVVLEAGAGEPPYELWVDKSTTTTNDLHFENLVFGSHTMHVRDVNGCETSMVFRLDPPEIVIKEYTSPNGDGVNDKWTVENLAEVYPNAVVSIYDRNGKLLKQFLGADTEGWDGTYNGHPMPSTDYWYQIDIEEINRQFIGHFTLIRR